MASMEEIAKSVVSPSGMAAASATRVVTDAFQLLVPPEEEYVESDVVIEKIEFAAYAVGGLGAAAETPASGVRASSRVSIPLADSAGGSAVVERDIVLYGPGDVRGLDAAQIVRRYPAPGTRTAEETVLAHIEFDRPEMPWAFSAARAADRLRPWLTLIVVEKAHVQWHPATAMLPLIEVPVDELPNLVDAHLWAHAQVPQSETASIKTRLSPEFARVNLSRLVSPRVLREETEYLAAVVPTTDVGARGGRGLTDGTLAHAWSGSGTVVLPVYDSWEFRTGPDGDFATLALRLKGVVAPYEVGRRFIDVSEPGRPLTSLPSGASGGKQVLRCALYSPTPAPPEKAEAEHASWPQDKTDELRAQLDLPAQLEGEQEYSGTIPDLPIVGPRIYAGNHRAAKTVTGTDWFAQLNLTPAHRIVGGLGTRVVQHDQEELMQAAWLQVGEVEKANRAIALAQLAELLASRLHTRLTSLVPTHLAQVAAPLATRVSLTTGRTLAADIAASATPATAMTGAFRRTLRPTGPVLRHAPAATRARAGTILGDGTRLRDFTRLYENPDGVRGLTSASIAELDLSAAGRALGVTPDKVAVELSQATGAVQGGIVAHLADPSRWRDPQRGFDLGAVVAERWSAAVLRESSIPAVAKVREQRVAPLVAELAITGATERLPLRGALEKQALTLNNALIDRLGATRTPTRVRGRFDVSVLKKVTDRADKATKTKAFTDLARMAAKPVAPVLDRMRELPVDRLRAALPELVDSAGVMSIAPVPRRATLAVDALAEAIQPSKTVRSALLGRLRLSSDLLDRVVRPDRIRRIMAAPTFIRPMYQALEDYDREWLVPGLGLLPDSDFVTVLSTNSAFMEAFLIGLSDEMGRELRWRGYPTDQCGTYFRRFWDDRQDELAQQIHAFSRTELRSHISVGGDGGSDPRAVIVVKSELVRRYPDVIIQAVKNHGTQTEPQFDGPQAVVARQLFSAYLQPDYALVGVDLSVDEIDEPEWWITIAEHPTATRFKRPRDANLLAGSKFLRVPGAASGADYAAGSLHNPARVAFHATDLVKRGA